MLTMADFLSDMFRMPTVIFVIGGAIAIVAIVFGTIASAVTSVSTARERERTRREIAAYVAEGTIDADKAIEMLKVGDAGAERTV
jgi:hypothetical protein